MTIFGLSFTTICILNVLEKQIEISKKLKNKKAHIKTNKLIY